MTSEKIRIGQLDSDSTDAAEREAKLISFEEKPPSNTGKDINKKITSLDRDFEQMRAELVHINQSVEVGMDRLGDTDTDLTAKVSETYKRLGEIDNAYKALIAISSRIDADIQKINGNVSEVAVQSATGLKNLEQTSITQSNEFTQKNQKVVSKVSQLVETSKLTSEMFTQKIQAATDGMLLIEKNVIAEIERLSAVTDSKTDAIQSSVESNKAKIIKLQSVDEVIIRRATILEISSAELTVKSQNITASLETLQQTTNYLSDGLVKLKDRTDALEALTAKHESFIGGLQKSTAEIADKLNSLTGREGRHFNIFTVSFLLLVITTAVIYFSQQSQFDLSEIKMSEHTGIVDNKVANLQQVQASTVVTTDASLAELEAKIEKLNITLKQEIGSEIASVSAKVETINDQVQSVEGRFNQSSPFSAIGDDNIIHGKSWLASMPAENFIVQLAFVDNKEALYEIAQRYNFYLKASLATFEVDEAGSKKYVLLSGNYATQQQAMNAIVEMPRYIDMQKPTIKKIDAVQKYLSNQ